MAGPTTCGAICYGGPWDSRLVTVAEGQRIVDLSHLGGEYRLTLGRRAVPEWTWWFRKDEE